MAYAGLKGRSPSGALKDNTGGIDRMRIAAAFLVVANHTSPLLSLDGAADFLLTRAIARVAVPFFLMASGYFLFPKLLAGDKGALGRFLKSTAVLYGLSALLYLPVLVYQGYFKGPDLLVTMLRDIAFNGTFYHLWYLPAALLGGALSVLLWRKLGVRGALAAAGGLYLIGLLGDSYYGLSAKLLPVKAFYDALFACFDYTRNGLFLAPVFLLLGGWFAGTRTRLSKIGGIGGLALSAFLLGTEALLLQNAGWMRHDSMYLTLPLVMFFLFSLLLRVRGGGNKRLRTISMILYIIHPMGIILVRGAAKITHTEKWLIDNSIGHFLAVAALSLAGAIIWERLWPILKKWATGLIGLRRKARPLPEKETQTGRAWIEVDLSAIILNARILEGELKEGASLISVVKADAYGHGASRVCKALEEAGHSFFAVATAKEGGELREQGVLGEILVLDAVAPEEAAYAVRKNLILTIADLDHARALSGIGIPIRAHLALNTGMNRLGVNWREEEIREIYKLRSISIEGTYSHLSVCDRLSEEDEAFTRRQVERFFEAVSRMEEMGCPPGKIHLQSSYGVLNIERLPCDYARVGIALYGALGGGECAEELKGLKPALSLRAKVALVRELSPGEEAGYGRAIRAGAEKLRLAVLNIGYADGIPRTLQGGRVLIGGQSAPIVGLVCMDMLLCDVTLAPGVRAGMTATLIGRDGELEIPASELAQAAGTIPNELLSRLGPRLGRVYL